MTIKEALLSLNSYPIQSSFIEKVGVDRVLDITEDYTLAVSTSDSYRLATADVYFYLSGSLNISEQEVSLSQQQEDKKRFLTLANKIYLELGDDKYTGKGTYGFKGENW